MYLCYIDESGTPELSGNTSHFVLAGLSIPIWRWRDCDRDVKAIKKKYLIDEAEIHIAWLLRPYLEQTRVSDFDKLDHRQRISQIESIRRAELLRLQRTNPKQYKQTRKNYEKTKNYTHLSITERQGWLANWLVVLLTGVLRDCLPSALIKYILTRHVQVERLMNSRLSKLSRVMSNIFK